MLRFPHPLPQILMSSQASFLSIAHQKKLRCEKFLDEMEQVMPWTAMLGAIAPFYVEKALGRKHKELKMMLKIYFLQQWYDLSDPGMEEAIYDRNSFQKFLEIDLLGDSVPDETTILNFRHLLEEHELQEQFLVIVNGILEQKGITVKHGTITDATIVAAPPSTKNKEKKRDPEMHQTKKGNQWYFGMKAHIGTDTKGFVHTIEVTKASVHDGEVQDRLYHGEEKAKFGDSAYQSKEKKQKARAAKIFWGVADKAARNHPLSRSQQKRNHQTSGVRSFVEHPFQVIKCQWHHRKVRYRGLKKNGLQFTGLFALCNLYRARKMLLAPA
jgi:transposase, IS5 family